LRLRQSLDRGRDARAWNVGSHRTRRTRRCAIVASSLDAGRGARLRGSASRRCRRIGSRLRGDQCCLAGDFRPRSCGSGARRFTPQRARPVRPSSWHRRTGQGEALSAGIEPSRLWRPECSRRRSGNLGWRRHSSLSERRGGTSERTSDAFSLGPTLQTDDDRLADGKPSDAARRRADPWLMPEKQRFCGPC